MNASLNQMLVLYDTRKAAEILTGHGFPCSVSRLTKLRMSGDGPNFRRLNRSVRYEEDALFSWALSKLSGPLRSTSDVAA